MEASGLCYGCLRTLQEIAQWHRMSDDEKLEVILETDRRKLKMLGADV